MPDRSLDLKVNVTFDLHTYFNVMLNPQYWLNFINTFDVIEKMRCLAPKITYGIVEVTFILASYAKTCE